jgi:hypothetical protein
MMTTLRGNDIHLVLVPSSPSVSCCWTARQGTADCKASAAKALECKSVTAEISPHFRPDQWANEDSMCKAASQHPLRFKGQLMYDAGHRPCPRPPHSSDPARVSSWELHPVYAIDVCKNKSLSSCKADKVCEVQFPYLHHVIEIFYGLFLRSGEILLQNGAMLR